MLEEANKPVNVGMTKQAVVLVIKQLVKEAVAHDPEKAYSLSVVSTIPMGGNSRSCELCE